MITLAGSWLFFTWETAQVIASVDDDDDVELRVVWDEESDS